MSGLLRHDRLIVLLVTLSFLWVPVQVFARPCPAGEFSPTGEEPCLPCPTGTYQPAEGQTECLRCPAGQFQNQTGQISCHQCAPGQYQPAQGQSSCLSCPVGRYQDAPGKTDCKLCEPGRAQSQEGQTSCNPCQPGEAQPAPGQASCLPCRPGRYQPLQGQAECLDCPAGQVQPSAGSLSCNACEPGKYQPVHGQTACIDCPAGQFQNQTGQTGCKACSPGRYAGGPGSASCSNCPLGTFQPDEGKASCLQCPEGHFQNVAGSTQCQRCLPGSAQPLAGQSACASCEPGSFQDHPGQTACLECPPGRYQPQSGQTACVACAKGTVQPQSGQTACVDCPDGSFQACEGGLTCGECPPDVHCDASGWHDPISQATVQCSVPKDEASGGRFKYQGVLRKALPGQQGFWRPSGDFDMSFSLYTSAEAGVRVSGPLQLPSVFVQDGLFDVDLDLGVRAFDGRPLYLEIAVKDNSGSEPTLTTLSPRQQLTLAPYALQTRGLYVSAEGFVGIGRVSPEHPIHVGFDGTSGNGAHVTAGGVWTNTSDRRKKQGFQDLDTRSILARLVELPVTQWRYIGEDEGVQHIGPVAQDFYELFKLGESDEHIGTVDAIGVSLAAIQGLHQIIRDKDAELAAQRREIEALTARLDRLEHTLSEPDNASVKP